MSAAAREGRPESDEAREGIALRTGALFSALALLLLVGAISFWSVRATGDAWQRLLDREVASLVEAQRLASVSERGARLARDALITGDPAVFRAIGRSRAETIDLLARARARARTAEERAVLERLETGHARIFEASGALLDARLRGAPIEALLPRLPGVIYPLRAEIDAALERLERLRAGELDRRRRDLVAQELGGLLALSGAVAAAVALALLLAASLRRSMNALRQRTRDLRGAVQVRDEFLQVASHELRTPLAALRLQVEGLKAAVGRGRAEPARLAAKADAAVRQAGRLDALVDGLIDVSRLGESPLRLELEPVDAGEVVRAVVGRFAPAAARDGTELRVFTEPASIRVDRRRLEQALGHLLSNALRFGAGRPIDVTLEGDDEHVRLAVADGGSGIDPRDEERIFGRFERASSWRHHGGLGLGLFLTRRIAEAHGGSVRVSAGRRRGAVFTLELPRGGPRGAAPGILRRGLGAPGDGRPRDGAGLHH